MGLKPTQYRSAGEALLRRLRMDGDLPRILPIIDVCNAVSVAHATPLAVFDTTQIDGNLTVRLAEGTEEFETFGGDIENPATGEVIFADDGGHAHARRWAHRQARTSSARPESTELLIVSEAMHAEAEACQQELARDLVGLLVPMTTAMGSPIMLGPDGCEF